MAKFWPSTRPARPKPPPPAECPLPPPGWRCTRDAGHDGPCAAWLKDLPVTETVVGSEDGDGKNLQQVLSEIYQSGGQVMSVVQTGSWHPCPAERVRVFSVFWVPAHRR